MLANKVNEPLDVLVAREHRVGFTTEEGTVFFGSGVGTSLDSFSSLFCSVVILPQSGDAYEIGKRSLSITEERTLAVVFDTCSTDR